MVPNILPKMYRAWSQNDPRDASAAFSRFWGWEIFPYLWVWLVDGSILNLCRPKSVFRNGNTFLVDRNSRDEPNWSKPNSIQLKQIEFFVFEFINKLRAQIYGKYLTVTVRT